MLPDWVSLARIFIVVFTGFIAWMTHRTNLLLQQVDINFNVLLSLPETVVRLFFVGLCLFLAWLSGLTAPQLGLVADHIGWSVAVGVGVGVLAQLVVNLITFQAINRLGPGIYSPWLIFNILPDRPLEWLLVILAFIPPVAMEELLFRTLWLGVFSSLIPLVWLILITSVIFGWMHQAQGKLGMLAAGGINLLFAVLFVWTGQLLVTFVAHYTMNILQVVTAHFQRDRLKQYWPQFVDKTSGQ